MILVLLVGVCLEGKADNYYMNSTLTEQMVNKDDNHHYYKKTVTATSANQKITYSFYDAWYDDVASVQVTFPAAGDYDAVFYLDDSRGYSAQVFLTASIVNDTNGHWTGGEMTFNMGTYKYELTVDADYTSSTTVGKLQAKVRRASVTSTSGTANVSLTSGKAYTLKFSYDPVSYSTAPTYTSLGSYVNYTLPYSSCTFSYPEKLQVPDELTAYYVTGYDSNSGTVTLTKTNVIPASASLPTEHGGVILEGEANVIYKFYSSSDDAGNSSNLLWGTGSSTYTVPLTDGETEKGDAYVYTEKDGKLGFYRSRATLAATEQTVIPANKAFLKPSAVGGAREFIGVDFDNITAIKHIENEVPARTGQYYNLQGQPVDHPTHGLYILNGRKVVVK